MGEAAAVVAFGFLVATFIVVGIATLDHPVAHGGRGLMRRIVASDGFLLVFGLAVAIAAGSFIVAFVRVDPPRPDDARQLAPQASATRIEATPSLSPIETPTPTTYTVRRGDTLRSIALRLMGSEALWPRILEANRSVVGNPDQLQVGTRLVIPDD